MLTDLGKRGQNQRPLLEAQEDGEPVSSLPINTARRMQHRAEHVYQIQVDSVAEHSATSSQAYATWPQRNAFRVWGGGHWALSEAQAVLGRCTLCLRPSLPLKHVEFHPRLKSRTCTEVAALGLLFCRKPGSAVTRCRTGYFQAHVGWHQQTPAKLFPVSWPAGASSRSKTL